MDRGPRPDRGDRGERRPQHDRGDNRDFGGAPPVILVVDGETIGWFDPARQGDYTAPNLVAEAGRASMRLAQQAWRGGELLAQGEIRIGCVAAQETTSAGFKPCRIPAAILEKIQ